MASSVNTGGQQIGWKYSTPLQAEYLNTFIAGLTSPGLVTRPKFTCQTVSGNGQISISPFSMYIEPDDETSTYVDENGKYPIKSLVKITTTTNVSLTVTKSVIAIGFDFSFTNNKIAQSQWYGSFTPLTINNIDSFKGLIIGTVFNSTSSLGNITYMIRTNGADISDSLLREEGFDPLCWLSLVSPRRISETNGGTGYLNQLEVRCHNDSYDGYMCGHEGCVKLSDLRYTIPSEEIYDKNGTRATQMPNKYCLFNLNTSGLSLSDSGDSFPITNISGGIIAVVNASYCITGAYSTAFANNLRISPCKREDLNVYLNESEESMYIK